MATFSGYVEQDADCIVGSTSPDLTGINADCRQSTAEQWSFFRFTSVNIPRGSKVTSATLGAFFAARWDREFTSRFYGHAHDNSPSLGSSEDLTTRTLSTAYTATCPLAGVAGGWIWFGVDIKTIIEEIVNRPGWTSGNAITILLKDYDGAKGDTYPLSIATKESTYTDPQLSVTYTPPVSAVGDIELPPFEMVGEAENHYVKRCEGDIDLAAMTMESDVLVKRNVTGNLPDLPVFHMFGRVARVWTAEADLILPAFEMGPAKVSLNPIKGAIILPAFEMDGIFRKKITVIAETEEYDGLTMPPVYMFGQVRMTHYVEGKIKTSPVHLSDLVIIHKETDAALTLPAFEMQSRVCVNGIPGAIELPPFEMSGTAKRIVVVTSAMVLPPFEMNNPGARASLVLHAMQMSGSVCMKRFESGALTLPPFTMSASVIKHIIVESDNAFDLPAFEMTGTVEINSPIEADGSSIELPAFEMVGTVVFGDYDSTSTSDMQLPAFEIVGTVSVKTRTKTVTGALVLPAFLMSATDILKRAETGTLVLPAITMTGSVARVVTAIGDLVLEAMTMAGTETRIYEVTGDLDLPAMTINGDFDVISHDESAALVTEPMEMHGVVRCTRKVTSSLVLPAFTIGTGVGLTRNFSMTLSIRGMRIYGRVSVNSVSLQMYRVASIRNAGKYSKIAVLEAIEKPTERPVNV